MTNCDNNVTAAGRRMQQNERVIMKARKTSRPLPDFREREYLAEL